MRWTTAVERRRERPQLAGTASSRSTPATDIRPERTVLEGASSPSRPVAVLRICEDRSHGVAGHRPSTDDASPRGPHRPMATSIGQPSSCDARRTARPSRTTPAGPGAIGRPRPRQVRPASLRAEGRRPRAEGPPGTLARSTRGRCGLCRSGIRAVSEEPRPHGRARPRGCRGVPRLKRPEAACSNGSRLCENAAKTITRRHDGSPWLLIGLGDQQGVQ